VARSNNTAKMAFFIAKNPQIQKSSKSTVNEHPKVQLIERKSKNNIS
jgi:hypothetical protein